MKPVLGISSDINPADLPEGFYNFAKNISLTSSKGVIENEDGFFYSQINSSVYGNFINSGYSPIGTIVTKLHTVVFLTNNTNSIIGTYNEDDDSFTVVYDDTVRPNLKLNKSFPIKGEWYENFLGEIIIGWTDNNVPPKVLNLSQVALINEEKDILLFAEFQQPILDFDITGGGSLKSGTYWVYIQYENRSGAKTDWSLPTNPIYITEDTDTNPYTSFDGTVPVITGKQINLTVTNVDTAYDFVNIAIKTANVGTNVIRFYKVIQQDVYSPTLNIFITGSETQETLTPDEVLIKSVIYTKAKAITTLNSQLFLGNLQSDEEINLQPYVNQATVKWIYEESNVANRKLSRYSIDKSFAHDEVYCLYIHGVTKKGKITKGFHLAGRPVREITVGGKTFLENAIIKDIDNLPNQVGTTGGTDYLAEDKLLSSGDVRYYQTRDTCTWDSGSQTGDLGYWENQSETYPLTPEWGSLQGQKVRHHKFPSFLFTKENLYPADPNYYLNKLDRLGIVIDNLNLPQDIIDQLDYITISYAKRNYNNSLVVSNETSIQCGFQRTVYDADQDGNPNTWGTRNIWAPIPIGNRFETVKESGGSWYKNQFSPKYPAGGNHGTNGGGGGGFDSQTYGDTVDAENFMIWKAQSPSIVLDKPALVSSYVRSAIKFVTTVPVIYTNIDEETSIIPFIGFKSAQRAQYYVDLVNNGVKSSSIIPNNLSLSRIQAYDYLIPNTNHGFFGGTICNQSEEGVAIKIKQLPITQDNSPETISDSIIHCRNFAYKNSWGTLSSINNIGGLEFIGRPTIGIVIDNIGNATYVENSEDLIYAGYLYTILKFKENCYITFSQQDLIGTGKLLPINNVSQPVFNGDCFTDIYSTHSSMKFLDQPTPEIPVTPDGSTDCFLAEYNMFTETSRNIGMRHGSYYRSSADQSIIVNLGAGSNNNYSITPDYNNINDSIETTVFSTSRDFTNSFPHRIIKSQEVTTESKVIQWRDFLPIDYYEINKSKGVIVNLQGYKDQLLIHTERALFFTRDTSRLSGDDGLNQIQLSSGGLFDFEPEEVFPTTNGYTGTQHIFSCLLSRIGYSWIDAEQGKVFIWNGGETAEEISFKGLTNFFRENRGKFSDNPFVENGISSTWNNEERKLLFTVKNNNKQFTLSYSPEIGQSGAWISYHDYIADHYFSTRQNTFSLKNGSLYRHNNKTNKGLFYLVKYPSFIDVVFNDKNTYNLFNINWYTQFINQDQSSDYYKTITHLSVRNQHQHSGRISLNYDNLNIANDYNSRNSESTWNYDQLRSIVRQQNLPIIQDLFSNFNPVISNLDNNMVWFDKPLFNNKWFIIRLEYDNIINSRLQLFNIDVNSKISLR